MGGKGRVEESEPCKKDGDRVIQVDDNEEFGKRQARVYPTASLGSIREVFVLK